MADIFISYARADRDRIEKLSKALEAEGWSVWWDRHIESGAEFSKDIERELNDAKAVIVCWSAEGSESRWVKDEANIAAEAGKLLAVALDDGAPPIGFRQYHAVDFSGWNGDNSAAAFTDLARALKSKVGARPDDEARSYPQAAGAPAMGGGEKRNAADGAPISLLHLHKTHPKVFAGAVAALLAIIALSYFMSHWGTKGPGDGTPTTIAAGQQEMDRSKSIAVLPFADFSPANDQEWFSDGLTEEILNALARTPDLLVTSRTSSFKYKDTNEEIPVIAQRLGVEHLLEGSVRRSGDRLRVTAQLIRASDGFHLWSQNYDRDADDIIAIQEDIAVEIAKALKTAMDPEALATMAEIGTHSVEAYELYLRANAFVNGWQDGTASGQATPIEMFDQARAMDPQFAAAHAAAAAYYQQRLSPTRIGSRNDFIDVEDDLENFLERIDAAIVTATRPLDRDAFQARKSEMLFQQRRALESYERLVEAYPLDSDAWLRLVSTQIIFGDFDGARQSLDRLKPTIENAPYSYGPFVAQSVYARDYQGAAEFAREALRKAPNNALLLYQAHRAFLWAGEVEEARAILPLLETSSMPLPTRLFAKARQACAEGDRKAAESVIKQLPDGDFSGRWFSAHLLGDKDGAEALLQPYDRSSPPYPLASFLGYPYFDPGPYPNLSALIAREGIRTPPVIDAPFTCPPAETNEASIAVLPFVALSNDDSDEYFGKGIAEELLNALAQFPDLKVAARTSAFSFEGENTDLRDVGEKLGVAHVLEGSVRRAGDTVRITAQLIRVADGFHLWSETYERELTDVFAIQDEIVREISRNLQVRLGVGGGTGRASGEGVNPQAYEQYLRGLTLWGERDRAPGNRRGAITALQRSTQFDPEFAGAWSALGLFGAFSGAAALGLDPDDFAKKTKEALERAIALDSNNATASAGLVFWHATRELNVELGQHYLERALSLAPNKAESHYAAANFWSVTGDAEKSIAAYERAIALDPLNLTMQRVYAEFLLITGRPEDAFTFFDACMENKCLVAGIELFAVAAAVVAGDETRIAKWSPAALNSLGPNAEPPSFPFLFRAFVSIANDQSDAATFVEALGKIPPGALPNELQGIWAPVLADYVQKDALFTSQSNGLRHGGLLASPYAMAPYYGANPYPEWVLRDPRYHAIWVQPGMAELAAVRRANGQTAGLPLPIEELVERDAE